MTRAEKKVLLSEALDALEWRASDDAIGHFLLTPYTYTHIYVCMDPLRSGWRLMPGTGNPLGSLKIWPWDPLSRKITAIHRRLLEEQSESTPLVEFIRRVRAAARKRMV